MIRNISHHLTPIRSRQKLAVLLSTVGRGLFGGALVAVFLGGLRAAGLVDVPTAWTFTALGLGLAAGIATGLCRRVSLSQAARAADGSHALKDRAVTALEFSQRKDVTPFHELQAEDARAHLAGVDPRKAAPLRIPRVLMAGAALGIAAVALLLVETPRAGTQATPATKVVDTAVADQIGELEEIVRDVRELAREEKSPALEKLAKELEARLQELKEPGVDVRSALAKISEMQAMLASEHAALDLALTDEKLAKLGEHLENSSPYKSSGEKMKSGDYKGAAKELERAKAEKLDREEAARLGQEVAGDAEEMKKAGLWELAEATEGLAKGLCKGDADEVEAAKRKLCEALEKCAGRKELAGKLECKSACLSACKNGMCQKNSLAKGEDPRISNSEKNTFGMKDGNQALADPTSLGGQRQRQEITGTAGDGPSEKEVLKGSEGQEQAARVSKEVFSKFKKLSESVLDAENIPLGHRETIRRYFELIRPSEAAEPAKGK